MQDKSFFNPMLTQSEEPPKLRVDSVTSDYAINHPLLKQTTKRLKSNIELSDNESVGSSVDIQSGSLDSVDKLWRQALDVASPDQALSSHSGSPKSVSKPILDQDRDLEPPDIEISEEQAREGARQLKEIADQ